MDLEAVSNRIKALFLELGGDNEIGPFPQGRMRDDSETKSGPEKKGGADEKTVSGEVGPALDSELNERLAALERTVEKLNSDRQNLIACQRQVMSLLGCQSPEEVVHALRNLLNRVTMLKALAEKRAGFEL